MRVLVVEDEPRLNELISTKLKNNHYSVDACLRGDDAEDFLAGAEYDAVILDILLPGKDGLAVLRDLRGRGDKTPVLLLTAKDSVRDRVTGLDAGGDDYLVKPFSSEELTARVRALVRRSYRTTGAVFAAADLTLDRDARAVSRGGRSIHLTRKEFAVLEYLLLNKNIVLTRGKIIDHIWNYDYEGASNIVDVLIRSLRKKIDDGRDIKLIHTVRGAGYALRDGV